jgi:hypothetical protein
VLVQSLDAAAGAPAQTGTQLIYQIFQLPGSPGTPSLARQLLE